MAGLPLVAGGAGGQADPPVAQKPDDDLALIARQGDRQNVGGGPLPHPLQAGDLGGEPLEGLLLQGGHVGHIPLQGGRPRLHRRGEGGNLSGGLGARAQAALLAAPPDHGRELQAAADVQGPNPLGGVDLVPAHRQQVRPQLFGGEGHLQEALDRVAVDEGLGLLMDQFGRLGHGQDGAQLVVHQHHGHQHRVRPQGPLQVVQGDIPRPVGLEIGDLIPLPLQGLAGFQHGGVLIGGGDDVLSGAAAQFHRPLDGPVVPLGAAGGKEELLGPAPQAGGRLGPVALHRLRRLAPQGVPGGWVPPPLRHGLHRRLDGLGPHGSGGRVVKIVDQTPSPRIFGFWRGVSP